jgi:hypothetical protein
MATVVSTTTPATAEESLRLYPVVSAIAWRSPAATACAVGTTRNCPRPRLPSKLMAW